MNGGAEEVLRQVMLQAETAAQKGDSEAPAGRAHASLDRPGGVEEIHRLRLPRRILAGSRRRQQQLLAAPQPENCARAEVATR